MSNVKPKLYNALSVIKDMWVTYKQRRTYLIVWYCFFLGMGFLIGVCFTLLSLSAEGTEKIFYHKAAIVGMGFFISGSVFNSVVLFFTYKNYQKVKSEFTDIEHYIKVYHKIRRTMALPGRQFCISACVFLGLQMIFIFAAL